MDYWLFIVLISIAIGAATVSYHLQPYRVEAAARRFSAVPSEDLRIASRPSRRNNRLLVLFRIGAWCVVTSSLVINFCEGKQRPLRFYTVWNYVIIWLIFTLLNLIQIIPKREDNVLRIHERLVIVLIEMELPLSLFVSAMFWFVLYRGNDHSHWHTDIAYVNITMHVFNAIFMWTEFLGNRLLLYPERWTHMMILATLYCTFAISYDKAMNNGTLIYPFFDTSTRNAFPWYLWLLIWHFIFHYLSCFLSKLKELYLLLPYFDESAIDRTPLHYDTLQTDI